MQTTWLLGLYALIIVIGELIVVTLGLLVLDKYFPSVSVLICISLYLSVFIVAWKLALRLTEPKRVQELAVPGK
jgi:hypothetical protein